MILSELLNNLWLNYTNSNPEVLRVWQLFSAHGEQAQNDHIAFRTLNDSKIGIDILAKHFIELGYSYVDSYKFEEKKLFAKHFEHQSDKSAPRIFISELILEEFSPFLREVMLDCISRIPNDSMANPDILYSGIHWKKPSFEVYNKLREESEYASWFYYSGFCANHFTVSVNSLTKFPSLESVNDLLKQNGFLLNDSGGEIKGTPEQLLQQSSIRAGLIQIDFKEGSFGVPGSYYEFAKRFMDNSGKLFSGFIAKSADKIFESTDFYKK